MLVDQLGEVELVRFAVEGNENAIMHHGFALQARADAGVDEHLRDPILHQPCAHAVLAIVAAAVFDDDGFDAGKMQQMRQH